MHDRLVLCAGLKRSGSTWQFNAVREILRAAVPAETVHAAWIADYRADDPATWHVVKAHPDGDAGLVRADRMMTSVRDVRAVAGSLIRMGWLAAEQGAIADVCLRYVETAAKCEADADCVVRYESIITDETGCLNALSACLGLSLTEPQCAAISARLAAMSVTPAAGPGYDPVTLLHGGHVGARSNAAAIALLPPGCADFLTARHAEWLLSHGYPTG